jgi:hypothetical protein
MELAASGSMAVVLGSCLYLGGLALVDLNSMAVRVVVPRHQPARQPWAGQDSVCGERYLLMGGSVAAIRPSGLAVISLTTGRVTSFVQLNDAADLVLSAR